MGLRVKFPEKEKGRMEQAADYFRMVLDGIPENLRSVGWAFGQCRRCRAQLYAVYDEKNKRIMMVFCRECYWFEFSIWSDVMRRAEKRYKQRLGDGLGHPAYPLEREIRKHLHGIKVCTDD